MYVYGHKRFTDDIENMTGASQGFPSSFTETLLRRAPRTVLADHVEVHLAGLDVRGDRLLHLLPPHQQPQVLRLEQRAGLLKLTSEKRSHFSPVSKRRQNPRTASTRTLALCLPQSWPSRALFLLLEEPFFMSLEGVASNSFAWSLLFSTQAAERELLPVLSDPPR